STSTARFSRTDSAVVFLTPNERFTACILKVTDAANSVAFDTVNVIMNELPSADAGMDNNRACVGQVILLGTNNTASGGTPPYSYEWRQVPQNASSVTSSNPSYTASNVGYTDHYLKVIDAKGCVAYDTITITVSQPITVDVGSAKETCPLTPVQIGFYGMAKGGQEPYTYRWDNMPGFGGSQSIANPNVAPDVTTTFAVTVTDRNGCSNRGSITVRVRPRMIFTFPQRRYRVCSGKTIAISSPSFVSGGVAPYSYKWTYDSDQSLDADSIPNPVATTGGYGEKLYVVTVRDAQGCIRRDTVYVDVTEAPAAVFGGDSVVCMEQDFIYGASGQSNYQYDWDIEGGNGVIKRGRGTQNIIVTWTNAGNAKIHLTITDLVSGCKNTGTKNMYIKPLPAPVISNLGRTILCTGETTTLELSQNYPRIGWSTGQQNTRRISIGAAGSYSVMVWDTNGCANRSAPISVTVNPVPDPQIEGPLKICPESQIRLKASDGFKTYAWNNGERTQTVVISQPGTFTVQVTDDADCPGISKQHQVVDNRISIDPTPTGTALLDKETEFDYPAAVASYKNTDDEPLTIGELTLYPLTELSIEKADISGRSVDVANIRGQILQVGERLNIYLKFRPWVPDTTTYRLNLAIISPCFNTFPLDIETSSYDQRITSYAAVGNNESYFPGTEARIPMNIRFASEVDSVENATLYATVRLNGRLMAPQGVTKGTVVRHDTLPGMWHRMVIKMTGVTIKKTTPIQLGEIYGTAIATTFFKDSVYLEKIEWDSTTVVKVPRVRLRNGILNITPYCYPRDVIILPEEKTTIQIAPNPAGELANVNINTNMTGVYKMQLYSTDGKIVFSHNAIVQREKSVIPLDVSHLAGGYYPLVVTTPTHVQILNVLVQR
ncbi:MAG: hypothetical protein JNL32_08700, partial [Candidatus Kapabacteria bacterium]|nr:hypothetical protein [Candidatus Kapabacteria bacterium]